MARALIVGCGCRGRALGRALLEEGWAVRGTTRDEAHCDEIAAAGIEPAVADPDRLLTILELIDDVAVICWLLGSATGPPGQLETLHGARLERLLEEIVDTPVRGVVYESSGTVARQHLEAGEELLRAARERWRIPHSLIDADPRHHETWVPTAKAATGAVLA